MPLPISLIGAPTDIGAGSLGARMGPEAMRVAGLQAALERHGLQVHDLGNLAGPANPWLPPENGYRHLAEVVAWNQAVHDAMLAELQRQRLPILLFGRAFWEKLINFQHLVDTGMISPGDLGLFHYVETAEDAWARLAEHYGFDATPTETGAFADDI